MVPNVVTLFGGSGFIGRHVVRELAKFGCQIRVAGRDPETALPLKPNGDVGQIVPVACNIRSEHSVAAALDGADAVLNLVGILYESGTQTFEEVHKKGAERIARLAAAQGIDRYVHMSALGIRADHSARYAKSKAAGEAATRAHMPTAMIVRPSVVFGPQDQFFNRFASLMRIAPLLPLVGGGDQKFQPVFVGDVAKAIVKGLTEEGHEARTFDLVGPTVYTFQELMALTMTMTDRHVGLVPLPFKLAKLQAAVMELLPVPPLTRDQVELLKYDNVANGDLPTQADLGIAPTAAEVILPTYLDIYRRGGRFSATRPV